MTDRWHETMGRALAQAARAAEHDDVPVGAVLVDPDGVVVAEDHNRREQSADPTAHAEILALRSAAVDGWRLDGHTLVVTLEPCAMCAGAAVAARLERIVYGAADLRAGACWSLYNIPQDERLNHTMELVAGVRQEECAGILDRFFAGRRLENRTDSP
jgi:tRNA(adenine34) deaminase